MGCRAVFGIRLLSKRRCCVEIDICRAVKTSAAFAAFGEVSRVGGAALWGPGAFEDPPSSPMIGGHVGKALSLNFDFGMFIGGRCWNESSGARLRSSRLDSLDTCERCEVPQLHFGPRELADTVSELSRIVVISPCDSVCGRLKAARSGDRAPGAVAARCKGLGL